MRLELVLELFFFILGSFGGQNWPKRVKKAPKIRKKKAFFEFFGAKPMIMVLDA